MTVSDQRTCHTQVSRHEQEIKGKRHSERLRIYPEEKETFKLEMLLLLGEYNFVPLQRRNFVIN
jgi:hypothetical protein